MVLIFVKDIWLKDTYFPNLDYTLRKESSFKKDTFYDCYQLCATLSQGEKVQERNSSSTLKSCLKRMTAGIKKAKSKSMVESSALKRALKRSMFE